MAAAAPSGVWHPCGAASCGVGRSIMQSGGLGRAMPVRRLGAVCLSMLARLPLSVFGRAFAASGYGISKLLHCAEHNTMPPEIQQQLQRLTTALVDRGISPSVLQQHSQRALPGVPTSLLSGRPVQGGFGAMPWQQHIAARHARWAARYLQWATAVPASGAHSGLHTPLWVSLASDILHFVCPVCPPACALLAAVVATSEEAGAHRLPAELSSTSSFGAQLPAGPLQRMAAGLRALSPCAAVNLSATPACCATMPLWGNPLLQVELPAQRRTSASVAVLPQPPALQQWFQQGYSQLLGLSGLTTLANLHRVQAAAQLVQQQHPALYGPRASAAIASALWGNKEASRSLSKCSTLSKYLLQYQPSDFCQAVASLWEAIPTAWKQGCIVQQGHDCTAHGCHHCVQQFMLSGLGWVLNDHKVVLADGSLTVRNATAIQLRPAVANRQQRHLDYIMAAMSPQLVTPEAAAQPHTSLQQHLKQLWHLQCSNHLKEPLWRLAVNGVPAAGGHDISLPGPCPCGWQGPAAHLPTDQRATAWPLPVAVPLLLGLQCGSQTGHC